MGCLGALAVVVLFGVILFAVANVTYSIHAVSSETATNTTQWPNGYARAELGPHDYAMDANDLFAQYDANEVAADQKYKGKIVVVTGDIQSISKSLLNTPELTIGDATILGAVTCTFDKSFDPALAMLAKGQPISARGTVEMKLGSVVLDNCTLAVAPRSALDKQAQIVANSAPASAADSSTPDN